MIKLLKRIFNYLFGRKPKAEIKIETTKEHLREVKPRRISTMMFRKQQLRGKLFLHFGEWVRVRGLK